MLFPTVTFALFFADRAAGVVGADAAPAGVARVDPARELRLLRVVGLALRLPARRVDGRQPRPRRRDLPHGAAVARGRRCSTLGAHVRSRAARLLQVRGLLRQLGRERARQPRCDRAGRRCRSAISFYTFMAISYVVDTYRGELVPTSFARFAVFQSFFPHLVAGPIVRASELLPQLESPRDPRRVDVVARVLPDRQRPLPEGRDREPPRDAHRRRGVRRPEPALVARGARRASTATPSRSSPTSAATRTSRSGSRCCSGSSSRRTSTRPTRRSRCRTSGGAGT